MRDILSKEEFEVLLKGIGDEEEQTERGLLHKSAEKRMIIEFASLFMDSFVKKLSFVTEVEIAMEKPVLSMREIKSFKGNRTMLMAMDYGVSFKEKSLLVFDESDGGKLIDLIIGGDGTGVKNINDDNREKIEEVVGYLLYGTARSMSYILDTNIDIELKEICDCDQLDRKTITQFGINDYVINLDFTLTVNRRTEIRASILFPTTFAKRITGIFDDSKTELGERLKQEMSLANLEAEDGTEAQRISAEDEKEHLSDYPEYSIEEACEQLEANIPTVFSEKWPTGKIEIDNIASNGESEKDVFDKINPKNIAALLDVPLRISVELTSIEKPMGEIVKLDEGSILSLEDIYERPLFVIVNGKKIFEGCLVDQEGSFGIKVTKILEK